MPKSRGRVAIHPITSNAVNTVPWFESYLRSQRIAGRRGCTENRGAMVFILIRKSIVVVLQQQAEKCLPWLP